MKDLSNAPSLVLASLSLPLVIKRIAEEKTKVVGRSTEKKQVSSSDNIVFNDAGYLKKFRSGVEFTWQVDSEE